jgi:hypothetical protein
MTRRKAIKRRQNWLDRIERIAAILADLGRFLGGLAKFLGVMLLALGALAAWLH